MKKHKSLPDYEYEIAVFPGKCDNCGECIKACIAAQKSKGKKQIPASRIVIRKIGEAFYPFLCCHCLEAPCVDACISGAMKQDSDTNMVWVDEKQCIACWSCVMSCPFGVVFPQGKELFALKCNICADKVAPCVKVCKPCALIQGKRSAEQIKLIARVDSVSRTISRSYRVAHSDSRK
ncbi:MAG: 4Fe-4S dicluster domain-containing protein [Planctomycetota bacterium]